MPKIVSRPRPRHDCVQIIKNWMIGQYNEYGMVVECDCGKRYRLERKYSSTGSGTSPFDSWEYIPSQMEAMGW